VERGRHSVAIAVLGPLEVTVRGRAVPLGSTHLRRLLAALVVEHGHVVPVDQLIEILWGDEPPVRPSGALQTLVYRLRAVFAGGDDGAARDVVVTRPPGYALEAADALDSVHFEERVAPAQSLAREGDARSVVSVLDDALALWRDPALVEFAFEEFARSEAARLDELRLVAIEDRIDARLALGDHAALVGELEALVAAHPYRERLWGQLMLALYRDERQAEALRAFGRLRGLLGEELGIEPSVSLVVSKKRSCYRSRILTGRHRP
jgi:DNA-binding SARP family transcriptional activator